jgi:phage terminase large subunit
MGPNDREAVARALGTPSGYAHVRLGFKLHPRQAAVLDDLFAKPKQRLAFFCGNEVGKTSRVGVAAILYALEIKRARVQVTSASDRQLKEQLVPNLKRQAHRFGKWDFLDRSIKIGGINQALFYTGRDEGTFQGFHEESETGGERIPQLIIVDESAAVRDEILGAAEDRCNPTWLLFMGSPLDPSGKFYRMSTELAGFYAVHRLSKLDCILPKGGWHDPEDIARTIAKNNGIEIGRAREIVLTGQHGGEIKDPLTLSSIFGEFATYVEYALLTLTEFEKAMENPPRFAPGDRHAFCDFAGGRAKNVFACRNGNRAWIEKKWVEPNEMTAVGEFVRLFRKANQEWGLQAEEIEGDGDGLGGPMVRRIQELGWPINDFHGGAAARFNPRYHDAWTESWAEAAGRLKACDVIVTRDGDFQSQILGRKIKPHSSGKMKLESKEEMRRRGLASPDEADALCVALSGCPKSFNIAGTPEWNEGWVQQLAEEIGSGQLPGASFG